MSKGDVLNMAIEDVENILSSGGFEVDVDFETKDHVTSVNIEAIAMQHHMAFNTDGQVVNSDQPHVTVSEAVLNAAGFPVRNGDNEVAMIGVIIKYTDALGVEGSYVVSENLPDNTLGLITLILSRYE